MALDILQRSATGLWDKTTGFVDSIVDFIRGSESIISAVDLEGNPLGTRAVYLGAVTSMSFNTSSNKSGRQVESLTVYNDTIKRAPESLNMTAVILRSELDELKRLSDLGTPITITINKWKEKGILSSGVLPLYSIDTLSIQENYNQKNTITVELTIGKIRTFRFYTRQGIYAKYKEGDNITGGKITESNASNELAEKRGFFEIIGDYIGNNFKIIRDDV